MASDLKTFLNGETGKVTHLADHQGKMATKLYTVCFTVNAVVMPDSKQTPNSLHSCMKVGDNLHYNAKMTTDPVTLLPTYIATKVWFPNTKRKADEESPPVTAKMLRKTIAKMLKERGPLTKEQLHFRLQSLGTEWCRLYSDTPEGLWAFVSFHKVHFLLTDDHVSLIEGGKPLVQKCIQVIKGLLRPLGSTLLDQLYELLQGCERDVRHFIFSSKALYSFLETHPDDFVILPDNTVFPVELGDAKSGDEPPFRAAKEDAALSGIVQCLVSLLDGVKYMYINQLFKGLGEAMPDAIKVVGTKKDLQELLIDNPGTFLVHPNQTVQLIKSDDTASGKPGNGLTAKGVAFITAILKGKGPVGVDQLVAMVAGAPQEVREYIGDTRDKVIVFLMCSKAFRITDAGVVLRRNKTKAANPQKHNSCLGHFSGPIQSLGAQFGFIRHGSSLADNIFFDANSYMEPDVELKSVLACGDLVDCLFHNTQPDKRCKYRAVAVWRAPRADDGVSELLSLPTILTSPVYFGDAKVAYLEGDLGYCCLHNSDADSLIEFQEDEKDKPALITFHLGHIQGQRKLHAQLKKGARVMFLARKCQAGRDSIYPVHGNVISMWPSTKSSDTATSRDLFSVTAEVQELTSEGGRLSFGKDLWADSITFGWKQVMSSTTGLRDKVVHVSIGDSFWCIVASGQMSKDSSKWVAIELFPCNLDLETNPPTRYLSFPALPLSRQPSLNAINLKDPEKTRKQSSSSCGKAEHRDMEQSNGEDGRRESSRVPPTPAVGSDVDLLLDLNPLTFESDTPIGGTTRPETDVPKLVDGIGKMVSKDNYGGILETEGGDVLKFTAHAFFYQGRPVSHLAFPVGTQVHFDGQYMESGEMFAPTIWIGKRPLMNNLRGFLK